MKIIFTALLLISSSAFARDCKELARTEGYAAGVRVVNSRASHFHKMNECALSLNVVKSGHDEDLEVLNECMEADRNSVLLNIYLKAYELGVKKQVAQYKNSQMCSME
jgi:hypothetical protein